MELKDEKKETREKWAPSERREPRATLVNATLLREALRGL